MYGYRDLVKKATVQVCHIISNAFLNTMVLGLKLVTVVLEECREEDAKVHKV